MARPFINDAKQSDIERMTKEQFTAYRKRLYQRGYSAGIKAERLRTMRNIAKNNEESINEINELFSENITQKREISFLKKIIVGFLIMHLSVVLAFLLQNYFF